jgi:nucleotide-binding universal stress UspA family protein
MLDNILIPTDGTEISAQAAAFGVQLAKRMGAKVTAVTVTTPADAIMVGEVSVIRNSEEYEEKASASARVMLDARGVSSMTAKTRRDR